MSEYEREKSDVNHQLESIDTAVEYIQPMFVESGDLLSTSSEVESSIAKPRTASSSAAPTSSPAASKSPKSKSAPATTNNSASRLTPDVQKAKYDRFRRIHAKRASRSTGNFQSFSKNREEIVSLNDKHGSETTPVIFRSTGPFSDLPAAEFRARYLTTKNPKYRKNAVSPMPTIRAAVKKSAVENVKNSPIKFVRLSKPNAAGSAAPSRRIGKGKKKGGMALIESSSTDPASGAAPPAFDPQTGAGHAGTFGGLGGTKSGKIGGIGGPDGLAGTKSGKIGGNGKGAKKSGKIGGDDIVVAPGSIQLGFRKGAKYTTRDNVIKSLLKANVPQNVIDSALARMKDYGSIYGIRARESQGECGSCWAEAAANSLNMLHIKYGRVGSDPLNRPSVQQLLDCVVAKETRGCKGGTPMDAWDWLSSNPMATEFEYPRYSNMSTGVCKVAPKRKDVLAGYGWKHAIPPCTVEPCAGQQAYELQLIDQLLNTVSIPVVYVDATKFQFYANGTFPISECKSTLEAGNHIVQLTGFGTDEQGVPFWEITNSWGVEWGMRGKIRLPFGVNACGMANFAVVPRPPTDVPVSESSFGIDSNKPVNQMGQVLDQFLPVETTKDNIISTGPCQYNTVTKLFIDFDSVPVFKGTADPSKYWTPVRPAACKNLDITTRFNPNLPTSNVTPLVNKDGRLVPNPNAASTATPTTPTPAPAPAREKMPYNAALGYVFDAAAGGWRKPKPGDYY